MQIKLFHIPTTDCGQAEQELNCFLAGHKVLEVEQHFCPNEKGGFWSFCVRYLNTSLESHASSQSRVKVDYRSVLNEKLTDLTDVPAYLSPKDPRNVFGVDVGMGAELNFSSFFSLFASVVPRWEFSYKEWMVQGNVGAKFYF